MIKHISLIFLLLLLITPTFLVSKTFPIDNYDYYLMGNGLSPAVTATGGINLTNVEFSSTSHYNPALLAFRKKAILSMTFRTYKESNIPMGDNDLPDEESFLWYSNSIAYMGVESEHFAFTYSSLARINYETSDDKLSDLYLDYYLDGYRFSYGAASGKLAFGLNVTFLTGRAVYLKQEKETDEELHFVDDRAFGYGFDFGAVAKWDNFGCGLNIPNLLSKIYWKDNDDAKLTRRLLAGVQYGSDSSFISSGVSRKFDFKSKSTYHIGLQHNIGIGMVRGEYQTIPLRIGAYTEKEFWRLKELSYSFGTSIHYGYFLLDVSFTTIDSDWDNYYIMSSVAVTFK